jgi:cysteine-rich repeat protein
VCGDSITGPGEQCDDGNTVNTDACTNACTNAVCGDGITRAGVEQCDDGNVMSGDGCSATCVIEFCGDGIVNNATETCDDGNTLNGDCCNSSCQFDAMGVSCTSSGADDECNVSTCNGAGTCGSAPTNQGGACTPDSPELCVKTYACNAGSCDPSSQFLTGDACEWLIVSGVSGTSKVLIRDQSTNTGDICVDNGVVGTRTTINGTIVSTSPITNDLSFKALGVVLNDVVTNNAGVLGEQGVTLPGMPPGTSSRPAGTFVAKSNGGFYDLTGLDPRVGKCSNAQGDILSASSAVLGLTSTQSLGVLAPTGGQTLNINPTVVGGLNVIDATRLTTGNDVTINVSGGGNANTVVILRIANQLNTSLRTVLNLTNGLQVKNFMIFANGGRCEIGDKSVGAGTLLCPNATVLLKENTVWDGQALGDNKKVQIGDFVTFTYIPFTGF